MKSHPWNHKRVYRIYCELELNLRIKSRKRLKRNKPDALAVLEGPNINWSMDFMANRLGNNRQFQLLNVLDDFNREGQGIEVDFSMPAKRVIRSLNRIIEWRAKPNTIRVDNSSEYINGKFLIWAKKHHIQHTDPTNRSRTPILSVTTTLSGGSDSTNNTLSKAARRPNITLGNGCGLRTTTAPTWALGA